MIADFTPANDLEETLVRAATEPAVRPEFYRRLLAAELYLLTDEAPRADGESSKPAGDGAAFITWESPSGPYVPLFSSRARVDEIARVRERTYGYVALSGKAAFARPREGEARRVPESRLRVRQAVRAGRDRSPGGRREGGARGGRGGAHAGARNRRRGRERQAQQALVEDLVARWPAFLRRSWWIAPTASAAMRRTRRPCRATCPIAAA